MEILHQVRNQPRLLKVLKAATRNPLHLSLAHIETLFELTRGDVQLSLRGLQSLIYLSNQPHDGAQIVFHHASFRDFLQDPAQAGEFHIGSDQVYGMDLCRRILKVFAYKHDLSLNRHGHVAWYDFFYRNGTKFNRWCH
jgi:hypothetical protein